MATVTVISPVTGKPVEHKRVAAYCRVSTNSADQQNSYNTQVRYYTRYIKSRTEWTLVDIFADEGLSGTSSEKRENFQRMITMCELKQIDLVVTKSVSRFARNVKETLEYVRKLKLLGIGVVFEKEGINTLSMGDEMLLNTFSAIAQEESVSISQNIRFSIQKRMQMGEYVDSNAPYGFRLIDKKLCEYPPESEIVKELFERYLGGMSTDELATLLIERKVPTKTGKKNGGQTKSLLSSPMKNTLATVCTRKHIGLQPSPSSKKRITAAKIRYTQKVPMKDLSTGIPLTRFKLS